MHARLLIVLSSILLPFANAQAQPDGQIVPFTSGLPACASLCGKLFDVQGACVPPVTTDVSSSCFCADPRLNPFRQDGTAGVSSVCGAASCQDAASLQQIQSWYQTFCNIKVSNPTPTTTTGTAGATGTGKTSSSPRPTAIVYPSWISSHWKWVVMLIVMVFAITGGWVGAIFLRRRYIRKKEKEFEMRPPVAWGPHQMQGATGGYNYGDGVVQAGHSKEAVGAAVSTEKGKRESKGWLRKDRT